MYNFDIERSIYITDTKNRQGAWITYSIQKVCRSTTLRSKYAIEKARLNIAIDKIVVKVEKGNSVFGKSGSIGGGIGIGCGGVMGSGGAGSGGEGSGGTEVKNGKILAIVRFIFCFQRV